MLCQQQRVLLWPPMLSTLPQMRMLPLDLLLMHMRPPALPLCSCGYVFCSGHRHAQDHDCTFDYASFDKANLAKANNKVRQAACGCPQSRVVPWVPDAHQFAGWLRRRRRFPFAVLPWPTLLPASPCSCRWWLQRWTSSEPAAAPTS